MRHWERREIGHVRLRMSRIERWKRGEPHGRLRGATDPHVVDAEKTVEVGRNGKDGTCSECGIFEPKIG
jgi:hypothetical protein